MTLANRRYCLLSYKNIETRLGLDFESQKKDSGELINRSFRRGFFRLQFRRILLFHKLQKRKCWATSQCRNIVRTPIYFLLLADKRKHFEILAGNQLLGFSSCYRYVSSNVRWCNWLLTIHCWHWIKRRDAMIYFEKEKNFTNKVKAVRRVFRDISIKNNRKKLKICLRHHVRVGLKTSELASFLRRATTKVAVCSSQKALCL